MRTAPQIDEHVVAVEVAVLFVQVVGIKPDQLCRHRDHPRACRLGAGTVCVEAREHGDLAFGGGDVRVPEPERLPDPHPGVIQHREQQPVPQPAAGIQDRLDLLDGQHPRELARCLQRDRAAGDRLALADVVQERLPPAPASSRAPGDQQLSQVHTVPGRVLIERRQRRQLPVHRHHRHVMLHRRQHQHPPVPGSRREPQPGDELADVLQPHLAPVQATAAQEGEVVLQIVGIGLDRVRGAFDISEIGQIPLDRSDRDIVVPQHRPRLKRRGGRQHPLNKHGSSGRSA